MRAFLAVTVAPPAAEPLARWLAELRRDVPGVRWSHGGQLHLTVHFFGEIDGNDAGQALAAVAPVAASHPPFTLLLGGAGAFPDRSTPRVLWLGVKSGAAELEGLAAACVAALEGAEFVVEKRPYRPHCTLGRPRAPWPRAAEAAWRRAIPPMLPPFTAGHLTLYESRTGPDGAVHLPLHVLPLSGEPV